VLLKKIVVFFPPVFLASMMMIRFSMFPVYLHLVQEDNLFEILQFCLYLLAGITLLLTLFTKASKTISLSTLYLLIFGASLIFIATEEVSWGQRFFGWMSPAYFEQHNVQNETTLHNLDSIQPLVQWIYIGVGLILGLGWGLGRKMKWLPSHTLSGYFLPLSFVYILLQLGKPFGILIGPDQLPLMIGRDQELVETLLAVGVAVYTFHSVQIFNKYPHN
jgi:hypothetical protein